MLEVRCPPKKKTETPVPNMNSLIDEVSEAYKSQFEEESVLKVVSRACVGF